MTFRSLRAFWRGETGSVAVVAAIGLPMLVGFAALAAEFGHGLLSKAEYQRVADLAAYAGALAYSTSSSITTMTSAAQSVAVLNGLSASTVTVNLVASPRTVGSRAVSVSIAKTNILLLAPVLGYGSSLPVRSSSYAELGAAPAACILALSSSGTGVTLSGAAAVTAAQCTVASNASIAVPCGTSIKAKAVTYNTTVPTQACSGITAATGGAASITKINTTDPLASNAGVIAALAHISAVQTFAPYTFTPISQSGGAPLTFSSSLLGLSSLLAGLPSGCLAGGLLGNYTVNCSGSSTYKFGSITIDSGVTVNFNPSGASTTTYNINGSITNAGTLTFGPGTFNIAGSITNTSSATFNAGTYNVAKGISNSSSLTFKAGAFNFGGGTACNSSTYTLCNLGGTATFAGPSTFAFSSGIYNAGGAALTLGGGVGNSFQVGPAANGDALDTGGGSTTTFADATGSGNVFQLDGNINANGGGSCLTIGAAAQHDVDGFFAAAGGVTLGAGVYTFDGYIAFGPTGGGDVSCNGVTVGVNGTGVTLVTSGATTSTGSSCSGTSFCVANGYSNLNFIAPTSGAMAGLAVIGPAATSTATFASNASNTNLSGAFYYPNGPITMSGSASIGSASGQCLQLVGSQVTMSGGAAAASTCVGTSSGTQTVKLVQ